MIPRHPHHEKHSGMGQRGVSRPEMAEHGKHGADHDQQEHEGQQTEHGHMEMSYEQRVQMRQQHHQQTLWAPLTVMALGLWLFSSPFTFGYSGRAMMWNDVLCAGLLMGLGAWWCKTPKHPTVPWVACLVGVWLQFAPLVFWASNPAAYLTDTFIGVWVIALTILIPGMPNMIMMMEMGPEVPKGWSYNPSSWVQRAPLIATGIIGWFISRYLAAFQLGYIDSAWDPFFGSSTEKVLTSEVSKAFPISDAGLGAFAYTFEALMGFMGGTKRWRTMPWMVTFFGILVIPLGLVHITLVIMQPVVVGHWCTFCLAAAGVMLVMIPLTVDEVVAMCQFLRRARKAGKPFWKSFWKGGADEGGGKDQRSPEVNSPTAQSFPAMFWGVSFPWTLALSAAIGLWLMFSPAVFGTTGPAADNNHLLGAVVITVSVIAMAEVVRTGRFLNALLGLWIAIAPFALTGAATGARWTSLIAGLALILLSFPRGNIREKYGNWDRWIV